MKTQPNRIGLALACAPALLAPAVLGMDWPQYRGPNHDGTSPETIRTNWAEQVPPVVWRVPLQSGSLLAGFGTFTVSQGRAFTSVRRSVGGVDRELCLALDAATGQELWTADVGSGTYTSTGITGAEGPRSTPVVDGDRVYVLSAYLSLSCLDAASGSILWSRDLRFDGGVIGWESAAAPLIEGDLVFVNSNTSTEPCMMAVRKTDGSEVWRRHTYRMTHATPVLTTLHDVRQVIFHTRLGLVSLAPETGDLLWRYTVNQGCPYSSTATAASPVVAGDIVYCSAAYGAGAGAVRVTRSDNTFTATPLWRKTGELENHWSTPVHRDGYLYGVYGGYNSGVLKCVELATGTEMWSRSERIGSGGVLLVGGRLLLLNEAGELVLIDPSPTAYTELARLKVLGGKNWNAPAVSDGQIYARGTTEAVRVDVSAPSPPQPLRLSSSLVGATGVFRLWIGNADGSPLDPGRALNIDVLAATDLVDGTNAWMPFTNPPTLQDGVLQVDDPERVSRPQRFLRVVEPR